MKIRLTSFAAEDLESIEAYIAEENPDAAARTVMRVLETIEGLLEFPNIGILDNNSCSACQSTLLLFLKHHAKHLWDYFPDHKEISVAIGKGHTELPEKTLCLGNCTAKHKKTNIFVPGCPPISSEILNVLTGRPDPDGYKE